MLSAETGSVEWTNVLGSVTSRLADKSGGTMQRDGKMPGSLQLRQRPVYGSCGTLKAATFVHNKVGYSVFVSQMPCDSNSRGMCMFSKEERSTSSK